MKKRKAKKSFYGALRGMEPFARGDELKADFQDVERLARKSKLTQKDIEALSAKVNKSGAKHAKKLLEKTS